MKTQDKVVITWTKFKKLHEGPPILDPAKNIKGNLLPGRSVTNRLGII